MAKTQAKGGRGSHAKNASDGQAADKNCLMRNNGGTFSLMFFSSLFFTPSHLFVFGRRQQIDGGAAEWHCILGSRDRGRK